MAFGYGYGDGYGDGYGYGDGVDNSNTFSRIKKKEQTMRPLRHSWILVVCSFCLGFSLRAQTPCNDTLVRVFDSVCEGMEYDFNGRILTRGGFYYDTLPRASGDCDSVVILRLAVLEYPFAEPGSRVWCGDSARHEVAVFDDGSGMYYRWTSTPVDSSLVGQEHRSRIFVSPQEPTAYEVYIDYREVPQCPSTGRIELFPVEPVVAQMYVSPDYLSYDRMELVVEDYSNVVQGYHYGGWGGRKWYLNGVAQDNQGARVTFPVPAWMEGDSVEVKMVAYSPTCRDSAVVAVPFRRVALFFPNVFLPGSGDGGDAEFFRPVLQGVLPNDYDLWIYDRRGALVFHTSHPDEGWDGTCQGRPCPSATYVYKCRYRELENPAGFQTLAGTVTLVR